MIVHFIRLHQFLEYTIEYFEEVNPKNNIYYLISGGNKHNFKREIEDKVNVLEVGSVNYRNLLDHCNQYDTFIFHSLHNDFFPIIDHIPEDRTLCWIMYGMEVFGIFKEIRNNTFLPETRKFYRFSKKGIIDHFKPVYRKLIGDLDNEKKYLKYIKRFHYCAAPHPTLFEILREKGILNLEFLKFTYYNIEETVGEQLLNEVANGDNIFFGNSATFSNNHLDGFQILQKVTIHHKKLIVPLSYGDREVVKKIVFNGKKMFGSSFVPVLNYLPREEYNKLLLSCRFVIMNFLRPQARGNILTALWLGAKVFLQEENIFYDEFRSKGMTIFSMNDFHNDPADVFTALSTEEIASNRTILLKHYNKENAIAYTKNLVKKLYNSKVRNSG